MNVPVIDVSNENFTHIWPSMTLALRSATFVALDTELSGLGDKRALNARSIDDRFKTLTHVAKTRSIVSLGMSVFKFLPPSRESSNNKGNNDENVQTSAGIHCMVQTFNITVLCEEEYIVEPEALTFLVDHGFDFNKQYSKGIPYSTGVDKIKNGSATLRNLFSQLIIHKVPVVFHNAIVDLGFLYENLYCPLPPTMGMFVSDLSEMFQGGMYDTKYITEFVARFPASYLDYVFHKSFRENDASPVDGRVLVSFPSYPDDCGFVSYRYCALSPRLNLHTEVLNAMRGLVCSVFAAHGWCPKKRKCMKSHDIDLILDTEEVVEKKKVRKRKRKRNNKIDTEKVGHVNDNDNHEKVDNVDNGDNEHDDIEITDDDDPSKQTDERLNFNNIADAMPDANLVSDDKMADNHDELLDITCRDHVSLSKDNSSSEASCMAVGDELKSSAACDMNDSRSEKISSQETKSEHHQRGHNSKGHRAGFDSFMTGFAMATFIARFGTKRKSEIVNGCSLADLNLDNLVNKVYLSGKNIPLNITKTNFSKTSKYHNEKMERLMHGKTS